MYCPNIKEKKSAVKIEAPTLKVIKLNKFKKLYCSTKCWAMILNKIIHS